MKYFFKKKILFSIAASIVVLAATLMIKANSESFQYISFFQEPNQPASFVENKSCNKCHKNEYKDWQTSDHHYSMNEASEDYVLGDFNQQKFSHKNLNSLFFKKDNKYFIRSKNKRGELQDFEVKYTFGRFPLQQYLIEDSDGKMQAYNVAWDSRPKAQGGQKWFQLAPNEDNAPQSPFHFQKSIYNWNIRCASCHSTNLNVNYDRNKKTFHTTWSQVNVSCQSCHGPGSEHLKWADGDKKIAKKGFSKNIQQLQDYTWFQANIKSSTSQIKSNRAQIESCAQCHSRRSEIDAKDSDQDFYQKHMLRFLDEDLYHADGQVKDEVFVHGSFIQSKMYHKGVSCTHCHNPHSGKVLQVGNKLCVQCHNSSQFDSFSHHKHQANSEGTRCVNCHMPEHTFMEVDRRRDHSFSIPRPDLADKTEAPNACQNCHQNKTMQWIKAEFIKNWPQANLRNTWAVELNALRKGQRVDASSINKIIQNQDLPAIVRGTFIRMSVVLGDPFLIETIKYAATSSELLLRLAAVQVAKYVKNKQEIKGHLVNLLLDSQLAVRTEAANSMALMQLNLDKEHTKAFEKALEEYKEIQYQSSYFVESLLNLANIEQSHGQTQKAIEQLQEAKTINPDFSAVYINLADMYKLIGDSAAVEKTLKEGIEIFPDDSNLFLSLGLHYIRVQNKELALVNLQKAYAIDKKQWYPAYVYALAIQSIKGDSEALKFLKQAYPQIEAKSGIQNFKNTLCYKVTQKLNCM